MAHTNASTEIPGRFIQSPKEIVVNLLSVQGLEKWRTEDDTEKVGVFGSLYTESQLRIVW
jgi:hypothetical protein